MSLNISIEQLERENGTGVVKIVHWRANKTTNDITAETYGSCTLPEKDPEDPTFISFENLTQQNVIDWVDSVINFTNIESKLDAEIAEKANPPILTGFPTNW